MPGGQGTLRQSQNLNLTNAMQVHTISQIEMQDISGRNKDHTDRIGRLDERKVTQVYGLNERKVKQSASRG